MEALASSDEEKRVERQLRQTPYRFVQRLAAGAAAEVFIVRHQVLQKQFALKLIHPHLVRNPGILERFSREARLIARAESEHIVRIVDMSTTDAGVPFLVFELLEGTSLEEELLSRGRLSLQESLCWTLQLLQGLSAAHLHGIVHRDLTPANIFLQKIRGYGRTLKIVDFGLAGLAANAKGVSHREEAVLTSTGALLGSPAYASPEALRGEKLDQRADIYAAGLIFAEMLSGLSPLERSDDLPTLSQSPPMLASVLRKATARERARRYASAGQFAQALEVLNPSESNL